MLTSGLIGLCFQMISIVRDYGLIVLSRGESNHQRMINQSDILYEHRVSLSLPGLGISFPYKDIFLLHPRHDKANLKVDILNGLL